MASPHHAGYDEGAHLHYMDSAQQPDMSGVPGNDVTKYSRSDVMLLYISTQECVIKQHLKRSIHSC